MKGLIIPKIILETTKGAPYLGIVNKIVDIKKIVLKIMHSDSLIKEEYYYEVSIKNMKRNSKNIIRIILVFWSFVLWQNIYLVPSGQTAIGLAVFNLIFNLLCYFVNFILKEYFRFEQLNIVVLMMFFCNVVFEMYDHMSLLEAGYTPHFQITMLMFSNLLVTVQNALIMWTSSFSILIISVYSTLLYKRSAQETMSNWYSVFHRGIPLFEINTKETRVIISLLLLGCGTVLFSLYLHYINSFHKRYSFKKLSNDIRSKGKLKAAMKVRLRWFDAIMPKIVKEEYWEHNNDIKLDKWVYIKTFDNVSILFADIVGFTKFSSNKSASIVVALLNDLFNRFDELCIVTNCEKLGTLGDCYYCVSGCPISRPDHAVSCIEMGLGMCRIIKKFSEDYNENVEMRVGIHTGRVNAAIIGKKRFRFDVYSNDVIIANTMESSGKPGRVHISETVYQFIRQTYIVEPGDDLEIKREQDHGIAGMILKTILIKTYFVDPQSSHIQLVDEKFQRRANLKLISMLSKDLSSKFEARRDSDSDFEVKPEESKDEKLAGNKIKSDLKFILDLRFDPCQKIRELTNPPLNIFSLTFKEREVEWHFNRAARNLVDLESFSWLEIGLFSDGVACFLYSLLIYVILIILFPSISFKSFLAIILNNVLSIFILIINAFFCLHFKEYISNIYNSFIFILISNPIIRSLMCFYFLSSPLIIIVCIINDCTKIYIDTYFTLRYFVLVFFSLFIIPLFLSAHYFVKVSVCLLNGALALWIFSVNPCIRRNFKYASPYYYCQGQMNITDITFNKIIKCYFLFQISLTLLVMIIIIRETESNLRLLFYVMRENRINFEEAMRAKTDAQELLYNIIPKFVFNQLKNQPGNQFGITNFNYAISIPKAAVIFACVSNFFSKYYREDYKGGENALKLLHKIICFFDDIIKKEVYKNIEKIKTINDCYMAASGLNTKHIDDQISNFKNGHLSSLMYYAFDIMNALDSFNDNYIIGNEKFEIKIGYNFGPVTAGIIGATKPMYDIWGDTVNVSSRMYTTGVPGQIQVPHYVSEELKNEFSFKYRGRIPIKGKGEMKTYICKGPIKHKSVHSKTPVTGKKHILQTKFLKNFYRDKLDSLTEEQKQKSSEMLQRDVLYRRSRKLTAPDVFVGFTFN